MKKRRKLKIIIFSIFVVSAFLFMNSDVYAQTLKEEEIPNSTYIIGRYMLTREESTQYNGILTTKTIMMASKTIEGNNIDSMTIYYKSAHGTWFDALTGREITMPKKIEVSFINLIYSNIYGDINLDGSLDARDLVILGRYLSGKYALSGDVLSKINIAGDMNLDGFINYDDLTLIRYAIANNVTGPITEYKTYSITYNLNGGNLEDENRNYIIEYDGTVGKEKILNNPTKAGYTFIGWTGSNGSTPQLEVMLPSYPTSNLEYTANWTVYGDINLDGSLDARDLVILGRYLSGKYALSGDVLSKINIVGDMNLDGFINYDDSTLIRYAIANKVTGPITEYKTYSITYNLNGGNLEDENRNYIIEYDGTVGKEKILNNPTKAGYTFIGWTGSNGSTPQLEVMLPSYPTSNLEYTANWVEIAP